MGIAYSILISEVISIVINSCVNTKKLGFGLIRQGRAAYPGLVLSALMAIPVYYIQFTKLRDIFLLPLQIVLGIGIYVILSFATKNSSFMYIQNIIKTAFLKNSSD